MDQTAPERSLDTTQTNDVQPLDMDHIHEDNHTNGEDTNFISNQKYFQCVVRAYKVYGYATKLDLEKKKRYFHRLSTRNQQEIIGNEFIQRILDLEKAANMNMHFINHCLGCRDTLREKFVPDMSFLYESDPSSPTQRRPVSDEQLFSIVPQTDVDRVASILKQCMREWSDLGQTERDKSFSPLIEKVEAEFQRLESQSMHKWKRSEFRVLVPGCGLGRLPWEFARLGFSSHGVEHSYCELLISNCILNHNYDEDNGNEIRHIIFPFIHAFNNVVHKERQLQPCTLPDVNPRNIPEDVQFTMCGSDFQSSQAGRCNSWNAVVTCFFIDTSRNILDYLEAIYSILVPGGVWVNLGPLLYHYCDTESIELTMDEVLTATQRIGFQIEFLEHIQCSYSCDPNSLLESKYRCVHFVARKV